MYHIDPNKDPSFINAPAPYSRADSAEHASFKHFKANFYHVSSKDMKE